VDSYLKTCKYFSIVYYRLIIKFPFVFLYLRNLNVKGNLHVEIAPRALSWCYSKYENFFPLSFASRMCFFFSNARAYSHNIGELRERGRTSGYFLSLSAIRFVKNNTFTIPERRIFSSLSLSYG
jgi:hypothetical protein